MYSRSVPVSIVGLLATLLLAACGGDLQAPLTFEGDARVHDPGLIRAGAAYYVFSTGDERGLNDGNIQIRRSTDLKRWELVGTVFEKTPAWVSEELGVTPPNLWAPDIAYVNNQYYLYYAGSQFGKNNSVIGLATNATLDPTSASYKWVDQGMVLRSKVVDRFNAIDPAFALDADGAPWLAFGSFWDGIKLRRLDPATGKPAAGDRDLFSLASRGGGAIEAPSLVFHDGYYYLFVSFDLCCRGVNSTYKIMVGRSKEITGPYADKDGRAMTEGGGTLLLAGGERFVGPGGAAVYKDGNTFRLVHHVYDRLKNGLPQLQIQDLGWDKDGWPTVSTP